MKQNKATIKAVVKALRRTQFGNPILRQTARRLHAEEILSDDIQTLIKDMRFTLEKRKYGIGLAAPQVGQLVALSVIRIRPMLWRQHVEAMDLIVVNPELIQTEGRRASMWEGCISFGSGSSGSPYAKALRYRKIRVRYQDELANTHEKDFEGLSAHVLQHEIDHLNGILFVDRVRDTKSYITISEYNKRYRYKA